MSSDPPRSRGQITAGNVVSETLRIYGENFGILIASSLVVSIVAGVIQGLLTDTDSFFLRFLSGVVGLIASSLYTGFVVTLVDDVRDGRRDFSFGGLFSSAGDSLGPLIINAIVKGICVGIGLILLIVPGLYLLTIWAVTAPAIVVERRGGFDGFSRSQELVRGRGWEVFWAMLVVFVLILLVSVIVGAIGAAIGSVAFLIILSIVLTALVSPIFALAASIIFFELRGTPTAPREDTPLPVS